MAFFCMLNLKEKLLASRLIGAKAGRRQKSVRHMTPIKTPIGVLIGVLQEHLSSDAKQG